MAAWAARLPRTVARVAREWSLELGAPYRPGGRTAWVAPVRTAAGERAVLKVGWRHDEALHQAAGLRAWDGRGAVRCLADLTLPDDDTDVLLLEVCDPGTPLSAQPPAGQDAVLTGLLRRLWIEPEAGHPFRPLALMCGAWADGFELRYTTAGPSRRIDPGLARAGAALFRELPTSAPGQVLLATDLHVGNVLAARREPWLVIDPKPYVGDPAYDALQHLLNRRDGLTTDPGETCDRIADLLDLDRRRLRAWVFARAVVESVEQPWLFTVARELAPG